MKRYGNMRLWREQREERSDVIERVRTPRSGSQHKGDLFTPEGQRTGIKRQRQKAEDKREREGDKGEEREYLSWGVDDNDNLLWRERKQMWSMGKWQFIKGQEETLC